MKKLLVAGAVALFGLSNAQIQKGNWMVGGDLMGANIGLNEGSGYSFNINPKAAYFYNDNMALGGYVNLGFKGQKNIGNDSQTTFTYGVGALGRYYMSPGEAGVDNFVRHGRWFSEANLGIGGQTTNNGGASSNGLDFGVGAGYAYFLTPNIGLEGLLKYNGNAGFGHVGYTHSITFGLGFQIYLPSSKVREVAKDKQ